MGPTYPHLYVCFVGPAGVGKSIITSLAKNLWKELDKQYISSDSVSRASFVDDLREADRRILIPDQNPPMVQFNSMKVSVDELGVLLPEYERELVNAITHFYDVKPYAERKRTHDLKYNLNRPQLNILAGCTPSYLRDTFPETAWEQGLAARFFFIYSSEDIIRELIFDGETPQHDPRYSDLVHDLKLIGNLFGRMTFEKDALALFMRWHMNGGKPRPDHPRLIGYIKRRSQSVLKLCQIASADRGNDLRITVEDLKRAYDWLTFAEEFMPDIFKSMSTGGSHRLIEETYHYAHQVWIKTKKPIPEKYMVAFVADRADAHAVMRTLDVMVSAGILHRTEENKIGKCYTPAAKKPT